jgi:hypothetical protein
MHLQLEQAVLAVNSVPRYRFHAAVPEGNSPPSVIGAISWHFETLSSLSVESFLEVKRIG